jgi:hypothetical protein
MREWTWPRHWIEVSGQLHAPGRFTPEETVRVTSWRGDWVGPRTGLDGMVYSNISCLCRESNPGRPTPDPSLYRLSYPGSYRELYKTNTIDWGKPWKTSVHASGTWECLQVGGRCSEGKTPFKRCGTKCGDLMEMYLNCRACENVGHTDMIKHETERSASVEDQLNDCQLIFV